MENEPIFLPNTAGTKIVMRIYLSSDQDVSYFIVLNQINFFLPEKVDPLEFFINAAIIHCLAPWEQKTLHGRLGFLKRDGFSNIRGQFIPDAFNYMAKTTLSNVPVDTCIHIDRQKTSLSISTLGEFHLFDFLTPSKDNLINQQISIDRIFDKSHPGFSRPAHNTISILTGFYEALLPAPYHLISNPATNLLLLSAFEKGFLPSASKYPSQQTLSARLLEAMKWDHKIAHHLIASNSYICPQHASRGPLFEKYSNFVDPDLKKIGGQFGETFKKISPCAEDILIALGMIDDKRSIFGPSNTDLKQKITTLQKPTLSNHQYIRAFHLLEKLEIKI